MVESKEENLPKIFYLDFVHEYICFYFLVYDCNNILPKQYETNKCVDKVTAMIWIDVED